MGAQTRQAGRVQPAAARRHRHQLHRRARAACRCCRRCATSSRSTPILSCRSTPARALIGTLSHPLNRPRFDPRVAAGDRRLRHPAAAGRRRASRAPAAPRSPRSSPGTSASIRTRPRCPTSTRTCSTKAASSARASTTSTPFDRRSRVGCPRTRCSATICSKGSTRAPASAPTSSWSTTTRPTIWPSRRGSIAGCAATGRSSAGCGAPCRTRPGGRCANTLPVIARWKILDNLRRSLLPPALVVLFVAGLDGPAGVGVALVGLALLVLAFPAYVQVGRSLASRVRGVPLREHVAGRARQHGDQRAPGVSVDGVPAASERR